MAKQYIIPKLGAVNDLEVGIKVQMPKAGALVQFPTPGGGGGRIMSSMVGAGGLAGHGGIAGHGGGLAS